MKVVIVDYSMGNITSIIGALNFIGISDVVVSHEYDVLKSADKLILPGVGAFSQAMRIIREKKLDSYLHDIVMGYKKPILGICLGMQLMGMSSTEQGSHIGLGYVNGAVTKLSDRCVKIPHVGINQVIVNNLRLYQGMCGNVDFYFTHSYKMSCDENINQSICEYDESFIASFELGHIAGVQFHPELSQYHGLHLLKNFVEKF